MTARHSVWHGTFKIFGVDIKCHVLDNGERVIEADSFYRLIEAMENAEPDTDELDRLARWVAGRGVEA